MAQYSFTDFSTETNVDKKAEIALVLWNEYLRNDIDSLEITGLQLLYEGMEEHNDFAIAVAKHCLGDYMVRSGKPENGLQNLKEAADYFLIEGDFLLYSETLTSVGHAYYLKGAYRNAKKAFLNALHAGNMSGDPTAWFASEINLGKTLCALGDTVEGVGMILHFKNEAIKRSKYEAVVDAYGYLADLELNRKNIILAEEYLTKSIRFARKTKSRNHLSHAITNQAIFAFYTNSIDTAESLFREALELRKTTGNLKLIAEGLLNMGYFYQEMNRHDLAGEFYLTSLNTAKSGQLNSDALDAVQALLELSNSKDPAIIDYLEIKDSLLNIMENENSNRSEVLDVILGQYEEKTNENNIVQNSKGLLYWVWILLPIVLILSLPMLRRKFN